MRRESRLAREYRTRLRLEPLLVVVGFDVNGQFATGPLLRQCAEGKLGADTMESWFRTLKIELVHHTTYPTDETAKGDLFAYIEEYHNRQRLYSALGDIAPEQAELQAA